MQKEAVHFRPKANKIASWAVVGLIGLFGCFFMAGGIDSLMGSTPWEGIALLAIGLAIVMLAWRLAQHVFLPLVTVRHDALVIRSFWGGAHLWTFSNVAAWQVQPQRIAKDAFGRRLLHPVTVERLISTDLNGKTRSAILPGFRGGNAALLTLIAQRSGMEITAKEMAAN